MVKKPPPFEGLNIRILFIIPVKRWGFINQGSGLQSCTAFHGIAGTRISGSLKRHSELRL